MVIKTHYEDGDVYYSNSVNYALGSINTDINYTYDGSNRIEEIEEICDGSTITTNITYNLDGTIDEVVETRDGKTITTSFTYSGGNLISTERVVV